MTALYTENFDSLAGGAAPGWTTLVGDGLQVATASTVGLTAVSEANGFGKNSDGDAAYYATTGAIGDQAIRSAAKWVTHSSPKWVDHLIRVVNSSNFYIVGITTDGSANLGVSFYKYASGYTLLGESSKTVACSVGDTVHHETKMIGSNLEVRVWTNANPRPTTATYTFSDSSFSTGYLGLRKGGGFGWAVADDVVITDGAGGEDYFYPESAGSSATLTATTATPAFSGSAQVSPEASITVTTASPAFSGGASSGSAEATITATPESPAFSGSATGDTSQGTLTLPVLKNNTGTILANETGATVHVYEVSTGNKVVTKTAQTTNGSGIMTVTDALIVAATQYRVVVVLGSGAEGLDKVTAA